MTKITAKLISQIADCYTETTRTTGHVSSLLNALDENQGLELLSITSFLKDIDSKARLLNLASLFSVLSTKFEDEPGIHDDFSALYELTAQLISKAKSSIEDLRFPTPEQFDVMVTDLNGVSKGFANLFWRGLKAECLARDEFQLSELMNGQVNVIGIGSTRPRLVTSNDNFGLTQVMLDELKDVMAGKLFSKDRLGLDVLRHLQPFTLNWAFTPSQLRVGGAEFMLSQGMSYAEVADIQGIRSDTLKARQKKYRNAA